MRIAFSVSGPQERVAYVMKAIVEMTTIVGQLDCLSALADAARTFHYARYTHGCGQEAGCRFTCRSVDRS